MYINKLSILLFILCFILHFIINKNNRIEHFSWFSSSITDKINKAKNWVTSALTKKFNEEKAPRMRRAGVWMWIERSSLAEFVARGSEPRVRWRSRSRTGRLAEAFQLHWAATRCLPAYGVRRGLSSCRRRSSGRGAVWVKGCDVRWRL